MIFHAEVGKGGIKNKILQLMLDNRRTTLKMPTLAYICVVMVTSASTILLHTENLKLHRLTINLIFLKKIGPNIMKLPIFIYAKKHFTLAKKNEINIKVNKMRAFYFVTFPCGILGQVWYLVVSFPDCCRLSYFDRGISYVNIQLSLTS